MSNYSNYEKNKGNLQQGDHNELNYVNIRNVYIQMDLDQKSSNISSIFSKGINISKEDKYFIENAKENIHVDKKHFDELNIREIKYGDISKREFVGTGSFDVEVYSSKLLDKDVALKVFPKVTGSVKKRILREVKALSLLKYCKNIISIIGICIYRHDFTIVMELAHNGNLFDYLSSDNLLSEDESYNIILGIVKGLFIIHTLGWIHRDLKSPNVLLDNSLCPKINDFGMIKYKTHASTFSGSNYSPLGYIQWKAPEVLEDFGSYTFKSDIYSYGVIMWEIVHRKIPYDGEDRKDIKDKVISGKREKIKNSRYRNLIEICWNQNPGKRLNCEEIIICLNELYSKGNTEKDFSLPQNKSNNKNILSSSTLLLFNYTKIQRKPLSATISWNAKNSY